MTLPSTAPSGEPRVDLVRFRLYSAATRGRFGTPAPSVIIVPQTGTDYKGNATMRQFGQYLALHGLNAVIITLPYHGERKSPKEVSSVRFFGGTPARNARAFDQSGADVLRVVDWLQQESPKTVDRRRFGIVGISLGAIVAHLAMGRDPRIAVGVAALGSGDLADLYRSSLLVKALHRQHPVPPIRSDMDFLPLLVADPLTYADRNRPRNVLMIEAQGLNFTGGQQAALHLPVPNADQRLGIIAANDWLAVGLHVGLTARGISPERLKIVSFDGLDIAAQPSFRIKSLGAPLSQIAEDAIAELRRLARMPAPPGRILRYRFEWRDTEDL